MLSQAGHSKPEGPGVIRANMVVVEHFGQSGRERGNMVLRLVPGGSVTELSVTGQIPLGPVMSQACNRSKVRRCSVLLTLEKLMKWTAAETHSESPKRDSGSKDVVRAMVEIKSLTGQIGSRLDHRRIAPGFYR
jgi:hypothetical protein